jgi:hypothetical protein
VLEVALVEGIPDVQMGTRPAVRMRLSPEAHAVPLYPLRRTAGRLAT